MFAFVSFAFFVLDFSDGHIIFDHLNSFGEVIFSENTLFINDKINTIGTCWVKVVLKRGGSEISVDDVTRLILDLDDPLTEFASVRDRSR